MTSDTTRDAFHHDLKMGATTYVLAPAVEAAEIEDANLIGGAALWLRNGWG